MRNIFKILCLIFVMCGLVMQTVEAKRFGGGRSFGYQRSASSYAKPQGSPMPQQRPFNNASSGVGRWLGPLAGLAAGGLLASLFMGKGIGSGIVTWLLVLGGGMMIWMFIRNRLRPAAQFTQAHTVDNIYRNSAAQFAPAQNETFHHASPVDFESAAMLRDAKVQFIRLQAAYDSKNLNDLREFTTPEVFAEVQLELHERGDALNQTQVIKVDAVLLGVETENQETIASVSFSGLISENPGEPATAFSEIWHFKKSSAGAKWLVAGIQQQN